MEATIAAPEKKKRGRKPGVKIGKYNKTKDTASNSITMDAGIFRVKEVKQPIEIKKEEVYKAPGEVLDEIEELGRKNFEEFLARPSAETETEEEETEEGEEVTEEVEEFKTETSLNKEYESDNEEYEEEESSIIDAPKSDMNNQMMNGSIMFVIWDMFIPGVAIWLYGLTASPENKAKLKKIDRNAIGLTDDQKEEMEKMGLATEVANILFSKMPKWLAFIITGLFFSYMNVKIHVSAMND